MQSKAHVTLQSDNVLHSRYRIFLVSPLSLVLHSSPIGQAHACGQQSCSGERVQSDMPAGEVRHSL